MEMFDSLSRLIEREIPESGIEGGEFQGIFREKVEWARRNLKRKDRITWYLRWARVGFVCHVAEHYDAAHVHKKMSRIPSLSKSGDVAELEKENEHVAMERIRDYLLADMTKRFGVTFSSVRPYEALASFWGGYDNSTLEHLMQMMDQIPKLDAYRWVAQSPATLISELRTIEQEWTQEQRASAGALTQGATDRTIVQFPNGFRWVQLMRGACSAEGRAMGHCGNGADPRDGTTMLSLREPCKKKNEKGKWKPHCTFILDSEGALGEMKGRFNKKPTPELYPFIIELLKNPLIESIKGGGYLPQNNFSFADITQEQREEVLAANLILVADRCPAMRAIQRECQHNFVSVKGSLLDICNKCGEGRA